MVTSTISELNKLKNIQSNLDHAQQQIFQNCSKDSPTLNDYIKKLNDESKTDWKIVCEEVLHINDKMKNIRSKVSSLDATITINLMRSELFALKDAIDGFKQSHKLRMNTLQEREKMLADEVSTYEALYESWTSPVEISEERTFAKKMVQQSCDCPEVKEFNRFLQENKGHTNGWSWSDNTMFLKMRAKYKDKNRVIENLNKIFPDKTREEVGDHYDWYEKYCDLRDKQRVAIRKWKAKKQSVDAVQLEALKPNKSTAKLLTSAQDTKEKIQLWKEENQQRQQYEKQSKQISRQFRKELERLQLQKNSELKATVERWRAKKSADQYSLESKRMEEESKSRAYRTMLANRFIRDFQKQDLSFIKRRQALQKSPPKPTLPVKAVTARDPKRVMKPTETWISKISGREDKKALFFNNTKNQNLNTIPRLKAADWRK